MFRAKHCAATLWPLLTPLYLAVLPSYSLAEQRSCLGPDYDCPGGLRIKCPGASIQPMGTRVWKAQSQHSVAIPAERHKRRDQTDLTWNWRFWRRGSAAYGEGAKREQSD